MFHRCDDHGENLSLTRRTFNITQKISICKFNYTKNIYLFCYGNAGMRIAGGRKIYRRGMPGFFNGNGGVRAAGVWRGRLMCRWGMPGFFDGNGGVRAAGAWRLHEICGNCEIYERGMGAPRYTPRVCLPLCGLARAKCAAGVCRAFFYGNGG